MVTEVQKHNRCFQAIKDLTINVIDDTFLLRYTFLVQLCQQLLQKQQILGKATWEVDCLPIQNMQCCEQLWCSGQTIGLWYQRKAKGSNEAVKTLFTCLQTQATRSLFYCPFCAAAIHKCTQAVDFRSTQRIIFMGRYVNATDTAGCGQCHTELIYRLSETHHAS